MVTRPIKPDLYVVARFLDVLWQPVEEGRPPKEFTRTRLQQATRLNYDVFRKHLDGLLEKGLVAQVDGRDGKPVFQLTKQGQDAHRRIVEWVRGFIGGDP